MQRIKKGIPGFSMIVYTGGTFDIPHTGHMELFDYCRRYAGKHGKVVVALNTDEFVFRFKKVYPIMTYEERKKIISNIKSIDKVIVNIGNEDSKKTILKVKPDVVIIGMDWIKRDYCKQMNVNANWLNKHKIAVIYVPRTTNNSTTKIKEKIRA